MRAYIMAILLIVACSQAEKDKKIVSARIESCPGCSLNRLPEVRAFIYEDIPKYGIEWKRIPGNPPELLFFNAADEEIERHELRNLNRKSCNRLLESRGFQMNADTENEL
ncbi:selenoprotein M-like [Rhynchophorus ferrugineus]|uniref:Selenoprotein M n=1 Tax=Rhynchophorus ferrugineus TaxID=354439 RepID=A0A834M968_RHYFE|nr:hypothetical protein GWI33_017360 [Rhynchophorus ferrugineus]